MRKLLTSFFVLAVIILSACSSQTLQDAIKASDYGTNANPEILYNNDELGIVIFLTKNQNGEFIICRSSYEKNKFDRYVLDTKNDFSLVVDIGRKYEFIQMEEIPVPKDTAQYIVWGGIFNYPGAKQVNYEIHDNQDAIIKNKVDINKKHIFVDVLSEELAGSYSISYDVMDGDGNVMFSYH